MILVKQCVVNGVYITKILRKIFHFYLGIYGVFLSWMQVVYVDVVLRYIKGAFDGQIKKAEFHVTFLDGRGC